MERRDFVSALAAGAALTAVPAACAGQPTRGGRRLDRIGVQLYTVRAAMARDVEATLERVAAIGYREVEFAGYFGRTPEQIRSALETARLSAPACHIGWERLESDASRTLDEAARAGHDFVIVASLPADRSRSVADYRAWAARFNDAGRAARDAGLRYAYHNHEVEFRPIDGTLPYDVLLADTDPDLVAFEMDLFWTVKGGADPLAYFAAHPGRFQLVHVKDMDADGRMVDVGAGRLDFRAIFARGAQAGIRHCFVEHDEPADPFASIQASFDYLRRLEF
ncbi:MAG TPA: sugar phosphate isomerase/epimerase [Gemmatimonadales bacterium]|nr:sugar phosphate isomerase/epimerase [Gemmatimonadales bacterium]